MVIPEEHKATIRAVVEADPEVAQAMCDIPHLEPESYLVEGDDWDALPYCGCFVGVYAWMQECKRGHDAPMDRVAGIVADRVGIPFDAVANFAGWCTSPEKDELAVQYARSLLE